MNWIPIWALPNIELDEPVDSDFFALAPASDPRVRVLKRQHQEFRKFMMRFTDTFKHRIHPALILRREDVPEQLRSGEAAAGFRDLLVASTVVPTENWIRLIDRAVGANHVTLSVDDRHDEVGARDRAVSV